MIEVLPEVLVAKVGLGRVNTFGIHEIVAWDKTVSRDPSRDASALQPARPRAQPVRNSFPRPGGPPTARHPRQSFLPPDIVIGPESLIHI